MAEPAASSIDAYLDALPADRAAAVRRVREVVLEHLPEGYEEQLTFGMIGWVVPLDRYPDTYNGQPLQYAAVASQKRHMSLYLNCVYADEHRAVAFRDRWAGSGKRLDMGKSCVRFKRVEDLPLEVVGHEIASTGVDEFIAIYERARA